MHDWLFRPNDDRCVWSKLIALYHLLYIYRLVCKYNIRINIEVLVLYGSFIGFIYNLTTRISLVKKYFVIILY
jgi:hypothetical protein